MLRALCVGRYWATEVKSSAEFTALLAKTPHCVVDFYATWCGPCKITLPLLEKAEKNGNGKWLLIKVDIDNVDNQAICEKYRVSAVPTILFCKEQKIVETVVGALNETQIVDKVNKIGVIKLMRQIISKNPYTGRMREEMQFLTSVQLAERLELSRAGYLVQCSRNPKERTDYIIALKRGIELKRKEFAELIVAETGKLLTSAEKEVDNVIKLCEYYSLANTIRQLWPENIKTSARKKTLVKMLPLGGVYVIVPFMEPFELTMRVVLPQLVVGNCLLVRNSSTTPVLAQQVEQLLKKCGFDSGEYQSLTASPEQLEQVMAHDLIVGVHYNGGIKTGQEVSHMAGKYLKRSVLNICDNTCTVIMEDANMDNVVEEIVTKVCTNAGQECLFKHLVVDERVYEGFKEKLCGRVERVKYGDPMDRDSMIGTLGRSGMGKRLDEVVGWMVQNGFKVVSRRVDVKEPFYPIIIMEECEERVSEVALPEMLGPLLVLHKAKEPLAVARKLVKDNACPLSVFTKALKDIEPELEHFLCSVFINKLPQYWPMLPSGRHGKAGLGTDGGVESFKQFSNIKTVYVN